MKTCNGRSGDCVTDADRPQLVLGELATGVPGAATRRMHLVTHIANAEYRPRVERACLTHGYAAPVLCTPDELMEGAS